MDKRVLKAIARRAVRQLGIKGQLFGYFVSEFIAQGRPAQLLYDQAEPYREQLKQVAIDAGADSITMFDFVHLGEDNGRMVGNIMVRVPGDKTTTRDSDALEAVSDWLANQSLVPMAPKFSWYDKKLDECSWIIAFKLPSELVRDTTVMDDDWVEDVKELLNVTSSAYREAESIRERDLPELVEIGKRIKPNYSGRNSLPSVYFSELDPESADEVADIIERQQDAAERIIAPVVPLFNNLGKNYPDLQKKIVNFSRSPDIGRVGLMNIGERSYTIQILNGSIDPYFDITERKTDIVNTLNDLIYALAALVGALKGLGNY